MRILLVHATLLPVTLYGGTERVLVGLARSLQRMGHEVTFLLNPGSTCDFAPVRHLQPGVPLHEQVRGEFDVAHLHCAPEQPDAIELPYLMTMHGNSSDAKPLPRNTVFISENHAARFGSTHVVYNGLAWDTYAPVDLDHKREHFHFLGKAAWRVKNVRGAIDTIRSLPGERLLVLGGTRLNFNMGFRLTLSPRIRFAGMVDDAAKQRAMQGSRGLIFPVRWHEPFGLAIIESLYFGCPVFGTPYGSLPELVPAEMGSLAASSAALSRAAARWASYSRQRCHEYARDCFSSDVMARGYLTYYERVAGGTMLHDTGPRLVHPDEPRKLAWS